MATQLYYLLPFTKTYETESWQNLRVAATTEIAATSIPTIRTIRAATMRIVGMEVHSVTGGSV